MVSGVATKGNTAIICLSPYGGGMEMDAIKLARLLCDDINVTLFVKSHHFISQYYDDYMQGSKVSLETVSFRSAFSFAIIYKTRKLLRSKRIKNVIFFGASELRSLYFAFLGYNLNIIVRHGTTKNRSKKDWLHRLIYSRVNYHVAICRHLASNVKSIVPFGVNTLLKVIYPSLRQLPNLSHQKNKDKLIHLLHVGRVADGKGQKEAIEACEILYKQGIPFELSCVGEIDRNYERYFKEFVSKKPYASSIKIIGFTNDVDRYYQKAQIFIFPSKGEGLSNSFIEALSYGLICICYNNTSFPELRQLGFSFLMAEDKNLEDLKGNTLKAIKLLEEVNNYSIVESDLAQKVFNPEREKSEYLEILQ